MRIIFISFLVVLGACAETSDTTVSDLPSAFFDLKKYFDEEIHHYGEFINIHKVVTINEEKEEKILERGNLEKELSVFSDSDINKIAWVDKYEVDSLFNTFGKLEQITYTAISESMKVREMKIYWSNDKVDRIKVRRSYSNVLFSGEEELVYKSGIGYEIKNSQKVIFSPEQVVEITVRFLKS